MICVHRGDVMCARFMVMGIAMIFTVEITMESAYPMLIMGASIVAGV